MARDTFARQSLGGNLYGRIKEVRLERGAYALQQCC